MKANVGTTTRLTRRGRAALVALAIAASALAGLTAQSWNPCAQPGQVCVIEVAP